MPGILFDAATYLIKRDNFLAKNFKLTGQYCNKVI